MNYVTCKINIMKNKNLTMLFLLKITDDINNNIKNIDKKIINYILEI